MIGWGGRGAELELCRARLLKYQTKFDMTSDSSNTKWDILNQLNQQVSHFLSLSLVSERIDRKIVRRHGTSKSKLGPWCLVEVS